MAASLLTLCRAQPGRRVCAGGFTVWSRRPHAVPDRRTTPVAVNRSSPAVASRADTVSRSSPAVESRADTVDGSSLAVASRADSVGRSSLAVAPRGDTVHGSSLAVASRADSVGRSSLAVASRADAVDGSTRTIAPAPYTVDGLTRTVASPAYTADWSTRTLASPPYTVEGSTRTVAPPPDTARQVVSTCSMACLRNPTLTRPVALRAYRAGAVSSIFSLAQDHVDVIPPNVALHGDLTAGKRCAAAPTTCTAALDRPARSPSYWPRPASSRDGTGA
jgi:hypothetical protein